MEEKGDYHSNVQTKPDSHMVLIGDMFIIPYRSIQMERQANTEQNTIKWHIGLLILDKKELKTKTYKDKKDTFYHYIIMIKLIN